MKANKIIILKSISFCNNQFDKHLDNVRTLKNKDVLVLMVGNPLIPELKLPFLRTIIMSNITHKPEFILYTDKRWNLAEKDISEFSVEKVLKLFYGNLVDKV